MNNRFYTLASVYLVSMSFILPSCADDNASLSAVTDTSSVSLDSYSADASAEQTDTADNDSEPLAELPNPEPDVSEEPSAATFMTLSDNGDVVSFVEVNRYMGRWYEIATTPSFQQASCTNTQADYTFNEAMGWVDVVNSCTVGGPSGNAQKIQGRAELVDLETQAKLKVIFFGQAAPYWVVALDGSDSDEPYQWAVVSVPGKQVIWLLSRTPEMPAEQRAAIEEHLIERGFPVDTLLDTPQSN